MMTTQSQLKSLHTTSAVTASHEDKKDINANIDVGLKFQTFASQTMKLLTEILQFWCNLLKMKAIRADIQFLWSLISFTGASTSDAASPHQRFMKNASSTLLTMYCMRKKYTMLFWLQDCHTNLKHTPTDTHRLKVRVSLLPPSWLSVSGFTHGLR